MKNSSYRDFCMLGWLKTVLQYNDTCVSIPVSLMTKICMCLALYLAWKLDDWNSSSTFFSSHLQSMWSRAEVIFGQSWQAFTDAYVSRLNIQTIIVLISGGSCELSPNQTSYNYSCSIVDKWINFPQLFELQELAKENDMKRIIMWVSLYV